MGLEIRNFEYNGVAFRQGLAIRSDDDKARLEEAMIEIRQMAKSGESSSSEFIENTRKIFIKHGLTLIKL